MKEFALKILKAKSGKTYLFFVGQAGFILKSKQGQLLGVDLYLSDCVERIEGNMGFKRLLPKIIGSNDLVFEAIIATHSHYDHFDIDSIPELMSNSKTKLYASTKCKQEILNLRMSGEHIIYVCSGNKYIMGDYILEFIPCNHGEAAPDAVGVIITVDDKKIYIAGDTCFRNDEAEKYIKNKNFDVMIAPINGAYGNMNERECAKLSSFVNPEITIPCHYGMFAAHGGNPGLFIKEMQVICPQNRYFLMSLGEGIIL